MTAQSTNVSAGLATAIHNEVEEKFATVKEQAQIKFDSLFNDTERKINEQSKQIEERIESRVGKVVLVIASLLILFIITSLFAAYQQARTQMNQAILEVGKELSGFHKDLAAAHKDLRDTRNLIADSKNDLERARDELKGATKEATHDARVIQELKNEAQNNSQIIKRIQSDLTRAGERKQQ